MKPSLRGRVSFGPFVFDRANGLLWRDGRELPLPPRAIGVLARLVDGAGDVVSKADLLDHVWPDTYVTEVSLTEAVSLLRQTLEDDSQQPTYIQTLPRRGYRFLAPLVDVPDRPASRARRLDEPLTPSAVAGPLGDPEIWPRWLPWVLSAVLTGALVAVSAGLLQQPGLRERPVARFTIDTSTLTLATDAGPALALARDGTRLVVAAQGDDGRRRLYLRELARTDLTPVPGSEGAQAPFFSPDGRWIGYFASGRLWKAAATGGAPVALGDAPHAGGGTWTTQGTIVFAGGRHSGLSRVGEDGGRVEPLTSPDATLGEVRHLWPAATASGGAVVFTGWPADGAPEAARIAIVGIDAHDVQTLIEGATFGRPVATGHLLFVRDGAVLASAFDPDVPAIQGPSRPVLTTAAVDEGRGVAQFAMAATGALAALTSPAAHARDAWEWHPGSARVTPPFAGRAIRALAFDAALDRAAAAIGDGHRADIWIDRFDAVQRSATGLVRVTSAGHNARPIWTADGGSVIYASRDDGPFNLFRAPADATAAPTRLSRSPRNQLPASVSADGRLVYTQAESDTGLDIWAMPLAPAPDAGAAAPLVREPGDQTFGAISGDGRWLAYQTNRAGTWAAHVRDLQAGSDRALGPSDGGPLSWDSDVVLFVDEQARLRACQIATEIACVTRDERVAMIAGVRAGADHAALIRRAGAATPPQLELVLEWSKELSAKVPVRPREVRPVR